MRQVLAGVLGLAMAAAFSMVLVGCPDSKAHFVRIDLHTLRKAVELYTARVGHPPAGFQEMSPPLCRKPGCVLDKMPVDSWGRAYELTVHGNAAEVRSLGRNGRLDRTGGDDFVLRFRLPSSPASRRRRPSRRRSKGLAGCQPPESPKPAHCVRRRIHPLAPLWDTSAPDGGLADNLWFRVVPAFVHGRARGWKVVRLRRPQSHRLGIRAGDLLTVLHGCALNTPDGTIKVYKWLFATHPTSVTLQLKRQGKTMCVRYHLVWDHGRR